MSEVVDTLRGHFWYSRKQFSDTRNLGPHPRMFCCIYQTGKVVEYTELVTDDMLIEDPTMKCLYDDGVYLGYGYFHHHGDIV